LVFVSTPVVNAGAVLRRQLAVFVEFWSSLGLRERRFPILVFILVNYRKSSNPFTRLFLARSVRSVVDDWRGSGTSPFVVRELLSIRQHHAEEWATSKIVQQLARQADLRDEVARLYESRSEIPMRPLAKQLRSILIASMRQAAR
jgi:hypothetical protein